MVESLVLLARAIYLMLFSPSIFENFEEFLVASGSIAQAYRASLKYCYPGQQAKPVVVAVKVRHPGVGGSIRRDFAIINFVAKSSNFIPALNWLRLDESVQQFAIFMMSQVDLAREAAHLNHFIYNFRKPVYPLVHPAVLVETYENWESVSHYVDGLQGRKHFNLFNNCQDKVTTTITVSCKFLKNLHIQYLKNSPVISLKLITLSPWQLNSLSQFRS